MPRGTVSGVTSLCRALAVLGDGLPEVLVLLARDQADRLQGGEVLLGFREIVPHQVRFADVLVRTAVPGIELQRPLVMLEGELELPALAVRVAEVVLDVRVARVAQRCRGQAREGKTPVPRVNGMPAGRIVRVEALGRRIVRPGIGGRRGRPRRATPRPHDDPQKPPGRSTPPFPPRTPFS